MLTRLDITLSIASSGVQVDLRISATESARTQAFVNELKRLKEVSSKCPRSRGWGHANQTAGRTPSPLAPAWLGYYPIETPMLGPEDDLPSGSATSESTSTLTSPVSSSAQASSAAFRS
jgi:hypothetical protein